MSKGAFYLQFHITNSCKNHCKHCYQGDYEEIEIKVPKANSVLTDFSQTCQMLGLKSSIAITGGDPFMHSKFWPILESARKHADELCLMANPENVTDECVNKLLQLPIDQFQVSLDGLEKTHDKIRGKGSFRASIKAMMKLINAGIPTSVMSTVTSENHQEMLSVLDLSYSLGANWSFAREVSNKGCGLSPLEYMDLLRKIHHRLKYYPQATPITSEPLMALFSQNKNEKGGGIICGGCAIGTSSLAMLPDLTVMGCRRHPGSVLGKWDIKNKFTQLLVCDKMDLFRCNDKISGCSKCEHLSSCRGCRAAAYLAGGNNFFAADPQCAMSLGMEN